MSGYNLAVIILVIIYLLCGYTIYKDVFRYEYKKTEDTDEFVYGMESDFRNAALYVTAISLGLAAACLTALSMPSIYSYVPARIIFLVSGVILLVGSSSSIDSVIDSFKVCEWKKMFSDKDWKRIYNEDKKVFKRNQFNARLNLFNRGYFFLCMVLGIFSSLMVLSGSIQIFNDSEVNEYDILSLGSAILFGIYIFIQMMTYDFIQTKRYYLIIAIVILIITISPVLIKPN